MKFHLIECLLGTAILAVSLSPLTAETVELVNGDRIHGKVISLDDKQLKLQSEVLGVLTIPREKVSIVMLGDRKPAPATQSKPQVPAQASSPGGRQSVDDILEQLQTDGLDKATVSNLQKKLPLLGTPEVRGYFNEKVSGLIAGTLNVQDIRKDAINARDQINDLKKDLGPDAKALDGYLNILNQFIDRTEPAKPKK